MCVATSLSLDKPSVSVSAIRLPRLGYSQNRQERYFNVSRGWAVSHERSPCPLHNRFHGGIQAAYAEEDSPGKHVCTETQATFRHERPSTYSTLTGTYIQLSVLTPEESRPLIRIVVSSRAVTGSD